MKQYLDIVRHVLENGKEKKPVRKNEQTGKWEPVDGGIMTLACPNVLFSHNMWDGFPLLTTKKMAWKTIRVELEGFIKGITDKRWYQERGCGIWDEWANPRAVNDVMQDDEGEDLEARKIVQKNVSDLGPIYGYQWRKFNKTYMDGTLGNQSEDDGDFTAHRDQLCEIIHKIKNNPMDRRMVCSAWNPNQIEFMALPPCHYAWNVTIIGDELNLFWAQRSCDLMLGVPFNIASYGLLLELLAEAGGFRPGNLSGMLVDCHIYENQIDAAKEQITREPQPLPHVILRRFRDDNGEVILSKARPDFNPLNWQWNDIELLDYNPLSKIDFGEVAV